MAEPSILVAVSGEPSDDDAVKLACEMLHSHKGKLYILYVIEVERGVPVDAEVAPATAKGEAVLKHMEDIARRYKCKAEAQMVQARQAGCAVVQEAMDRGVDTIIIGTPYTEKYGAFSMGETIPYVLKNAPCKVVVWRDAVTANHANGSHSANGRRP